MDLGDLLGTSTDYWPDEAFERAPQKPTLEDVMNPAVMERIIREQTEQQRRDTMPQVSALMAAGWRFEIPSEIATEPWQWYWRAPPKPPGAKGRLYLSTNQAFNAMKRGT